MIKLLWIFISFMLLSQTKAQNKVTIKGQIENLDETAIIYLDIGDGGMDRLKFTETGSFETEANISELPSFISFNKISKRGKIEPQFSRIWYDSNHIEVQIDWKTKTFETSANTPYQQISEKIEALSGKHKIDYLVENPNNPPALYFAERDKENFKVKELENLISKLSDEFKNGIKAKRLENYIAAQKLNPLKIGETMQGFSLPDKTENHHEILATQKKHKLISLFSSGCQYSIASIALLAQLNALNNENIEIITIWDDKSRDTWLNTYKDKKEKITWINLWDEYGFASTYLNGSISPAFFVVNADGVLTDKFSGAGKKSINKLVALVK